MSREQRTILTTVILIIFFIIAAVLAFSWARSRNNQPNTPDYTPGNVQSTFNSITRDAEPYYGQEVTLGGSLQPLYGNRVFILSAQGGNDRMLVVTEAPLSDQQARKAEPLLANIPETKVKGELQRLDPEHIERTYGAMISEELRHTFNGKPVLIAHSFNFKNNDSSLEFNKEA